MSDLNILLKQASGVHVGGTVDVVLEVLLVNVNGLDAVLEELVVNEDDEEEEEEKDKVVDVVVTEVFVLGGETQIVPPQVVAMTGVVTHKVLVLPLSVDVAQLVTLLVMVEQVVIGGVQLDVEAVLVVGGGVIQIVFAQVVVVTG